MQQSISLVKNQGDKNLTPHYRQITTDKFPSP